MTEEIVGKRKYIANEGKTSDTAESSEQSAGRNKIKEHLLSC